MNEIPGINARITINPSGNDSFWIDMKKGADGNQRFRTDTGSKFPISECFRDKVMQEWYKIMLLDEED